MDQLDKNKKINYSFISLYHFWHTIHSYFTCDLLGMMTMLTLALEKAEEVNSGEKKAEERKGSKEEIKSNDVDEKDDKPEKYDRNLRAPENPSIKFVRLASPVTLK